MNFEGFFFYALSSCALEIFRLFDFVLSYVLDKTVLALLEHRLRFEKVAHRACSGFVIVSLKAQVFLALDYAVLRYFNLFVGLV